ncbi:MAG TPA: T9SS type A sorting domain-containing protein [Puia sp.]|nr:T9SS type A sorting domain-containing protein [Puia sp.]
MKHFLKIVIAVFVFIMPFSGESQSCTPLGNQTTYGTNNVWIGYVYQGKNFNTYKGYVTEGTSSTPNFDESFGGNQVSYSTNGCSVYTDTFSVRYKLTLDLTGVYDITIGGDDGIRLSIDGGNTWLINHWNDQGYTTYTTFSVNFSGATSVVLEYYENFGGNRVSFSITPGCVAPSDDQTVYGTGNKWIGYIYSGTNFSNYKGKVTEGASNNMNFDESFGGTGSPVTYNTSGCSVQTQQFSAVYRLKKYMGAGTYTFTVGGDDGFRFSLDGGNTWAINSWTDQSYNVKTYTATLSAGTYNLVINYYQNTGYNRISFNASGGTLALDLLYFNGHLTSSNAVQLNWGCTKEINNKFFEVQRSADGINFQPIVQVASRQSGNVPSGQLDYNYADNNPMAGDNFYRLRMEDVDGTITFSEIIHINNSVIGNIRIYPTVLTGSNMFIETDKSLYNAKLEFFDISGRKISEADWSMLNGRQIVNLQGSAKLSTGSYVVSLSVNSQHILSKLVIVK